MIEPVGTPDKAPDFLPNEALKKCPYILAILNKFECNKETFRIHTLDAGAKIRPHRDRGFSFEDGKVRLHIPVETNDKVKLCVNDVHIKMKPGECWYCNFAEIHEVENNSDQPRMHLIMDCIVNDWLKDVFNSAMIKE